MVNKSNPVGRNLEVEIMGFFFCANFHDSDYVIRRLGSLHVYDVRTEKQPMC